MQQSGIAEAEDYIFEALSNGPRRVTDLARGTLIPLRTLQRAGLRLGIHRSRDGEGGSLDLALGYWSDRLFRH